MEAAGLVPDPEGVREELGVSEGVSEGLLDRLGVSEGVFDLDSLGLRDTDAVAEGLLDPLGLTVKVGDPEGGISA